MNNKQQPVNNIEENPFRRSSVIVRSPPANQSNTLNYKDVLDKDMEEVCNTTSINVNIRKEKILEEEKKHLHNLKESEERTFIELGNKLSAANVILTSAKNIHKTLRDNLNCAMALYQQLREYKEAIGINPVIVNKARKQTENKATQVQPTSPAQERKRKVAKTPATLKALHTQEEINIIETPTMDWQVVNHRKAVKKKNKRNDKRREIREQGEALTIKAKTTESYADVIKEMKRTVNPADIGVEIQGIRRTRTGELLVTLKKGEGQAEKLKCAISNTLGEDVMIRSVSKTHVIDIRDMDESTDENDLVEALMKETKVEGPENFKILNFRTSFGRTKQAIVQLPENTAAQLLHARRIRVGWIMCRVRSKTKIVHCFRCFERGHIASQCKGSDRSNLCRRCCNPGHKVKECTAEMRCVLCHENGSINVRHFIGSNECVNNRRNKTKQ